nr:hypothetical protein [Tanacetum cinerariifolium]
MSFSKIFFSATLIASSSSKSSSTKGDVLEGGGVPLNITLSDSSIFLNTDDDAAFRGKKPEFEGRKPESEVFVSLSSSAQTKKHDDKTK